MSTATDMRDKYLAAETAILSGQSHSWGDRSLTMANLKEIQDGRAYWEQRVATESTGGVRQMHSVAVFN